jgi:hypothetical protein
MSIASARMVEKELENLSSLVPTTSIPGSRNADFTGPDDETEEGRKASIAS